MNLEGVNKVFTLNLSPKPFPFTRTLITSYCNTLCRLVHIQQTRSCLHSFCSFPFLGIFECCSSYSNLLEIGTRDDLEVNPECILGLFPFSQFA